MSWDKTDMEYCHCIQEVWLYKENFRWLHIGVSSVSMSMHNAMSFKILSWIVFLFVVFEYQSREQQWCILI